MKTEQLDPAFEELLEYIKESRGFDFTGYKRASLPPPVREADEHVRIDSLAEYLEHLKANQDEFPDLFDTILINVTGFFRDPQAWELVARRGRAAHRRRARRARHPHLVDRAARPARRRTRSRSSSPRRSARTRSASASRSTPRTSTTTPSRAGRHAFYAPEAIEPVPEDLRSRYFVRDRRRALQLPAGPAPGRHLRPPRPRAGPADLADRPARRAEHAHVLHAAVADARAPELQLRAASERVPLPRQVRGADDADVPVRAVRPQAAGLRPRRPRRADAPDGRRRLRARSREPGRGEPPRGRVRGVARRRSSSSTGRGISRSRTSRRGCCSA